MPTPAKPKKENFFLESFKIIFSNKHLGEEAAIEHIENSRSKKKD
ncbi:hypothetical protein ES702_05266 [subsurface metagenome]